VEREERLMVLTSILRQLLESNDNESTMRRFSTFNLSSGNNNHALDNNNNSNNSNNSNNNNNNSHDKFEQLCQNAEGTDTAKDHLEWDAMYDIFQELGLDELVDFSDMKLLHDHVGGHYPTLIDFLKQGNVDRAESELHLLFHTIESQKLADLDDVFSFFDETGDGSISLDEFKLALKKLHVDTKLKDREVETLMRRFAHHGDGEGYHVDGNHIDYSDFLDYFGTGHDFLKAQSTMADIVIYMQQLVAVSKHKEKHSVSLSHSMSVHSPLHLNSVLESNRESSLKFSEFGKILGNINTQMSRVAEDNDDPNKWWSDDSEVAESIAVELAQAL
jgi:hypothetical protein